MTPLAPVLESVVVGDVMSRDVVVIAESDSMAQAAKTLREREICGAPVVDEQGRCVGVLSASDFVERATDEEGRRRPVTEVLARDTPTGPYRVVQVRDDTVARHMTPYAQTVTADTPLADAGREMRRLNVHRLIVTDRCGRPQGVITPLDILGACLADAAPRRPT